MNAKTDLRLEGGGIERIHWIPKTCYKSTTLVRSTWTVLSFILLLLNVTIDFLALQCWDGTRGLACACQVRTELSRGPSCRTMTDRLISAQTSSQKYTVVQNIGSSPAPQLSSSRDGRYGIRDNGLFHIGSSGSYECGGRRLTAFYQHTRVRRSLGLL